MSKIVLLLVAILLSNSTYALTLHYNVTNIETPNQSGYSVSMGNNTIATASVEFTQSGAYLNYSLVINTNNYIVTYNDGGMLEVSDVITLSGRVNAQGDFMGPPSSNGTFDITSCAVLLAGLNACSNYGSGHVEGGIGALFAPSGNVMEGTLSGFFYLVAPYYADGDYLFPLESRNMTLEPVPLPATGWLFLGALTAISGLFKKVAASVVE